MKRLFALLMLGCCLFSFCFGASAQAAPEQEAEIQTEEAALEEQAEETQESQNKMVLQAHIEEADLTALEGETSIMTMEVTAAVDEAGRVSVTQKLEMNIVGTVDELRFSFPEGAKNTRVVGRRSKSEKENGVRYLTVSDRDGFMGTEHFELYYTMSGIVSEGEESQIMTLPLLSLQDYRIGKYTFAVAMPEQFSTTPRFVSGYYNQLVEDIMTVRVEDIWVVGVIKEIVRDNDTLTMTLVVPEGYFTGNHGDGSMPRVLTWITVSLLVIAIIYWLRTLRNPPLKVRSRSLPPDGVNPGDLPFLICNGELDFNMLISHWAVLGYLSIHVSKTGHVILRRRMDMGNERRKFERKLFDLLFADSDLCDGASVRYKRVGEKAMQVVRRYWCKRLYERHSGSPVLVRGICWLACAFAAMVAMDAVSPVKGHGFFLLLALIAGLAMGILLARLWGVIYMSDGIQTGAGICAGIFLLVLGIVGEAPWVAISAIVVTVAIGQQTCHGGLRCAYGDEVVSQTMGFRRFMLHVSEHHVLQMQARDPQYFYKMLPYAEAMGQGRKFVNLFHDCRLEPCQWYSSARKVPTSAAMFYEHYCDTLDLLNLSIKK